MIATEDLNKLKALANQMQGEEKQSILTLVDQYEQALELIDVSHRASNESFRVLNSQAISDRDKRLQQLTPPDERYYLYPQTGKEYTAETIDEFLEGHD